MSIKISKKFKTHIIEKCKQCKKMFWVRIIKKFTQDSTKGTIRKVVILCPDCRQNKTGLSNFVPEKEYEKFLKKQGCVSRTMTAKEKKKFNLK